MDDQVNDFVRYMLRQQELNDANGGTAVRNEATLRRVEMNDSTLTDLQIGDVPIYDVASYGGVFVSSNGDAYSRLGELVGRNTHLTKLNVENVQRTIAISKEYNIRQTKIYDVNCNEPTNSLKAFVLSFTML